MNECSFTLRCGKTGMSFRMMLQTPDLRLPAAPDARQSGILDAIRASFIEKGFDGASMQDLARAAGMSVGNFYRYFPSKDAIIAAIVMRDMADVESEFATIIGSDDPLGMLRLVLRQYICGTCHADGALWAEITAAARRKPEIGVVVGELERCIRSYLTTVFAAVTGLPPAEAQRRYGGHAALIMMMVKANGMRVPEGVTGESDLDELILRTIDRTLDEIANDASKG
jgi:AcrR family transcriptional regulator